MTPQWYVRRGGKEKGPLTTKEFFTAVSRGEVTLEDQIRLDGVTDWFGTEAIPALAWGTLRRLGGAAAWLGSTVVQAVIESGQTSPAATTSHAVTTDQTEKVPARSSRSAEEPLTVAALSGSVVLKVVGNTVTYRKKCDHCGHVDGTTNTTTMSRGSRHCGSFHCFMCRELSDVTMECSD